jgi:ABC-2 type transport system permease protein
VSNSLMTDSVVFARRNLEHIRQVPEKLINVTVQPLMFVLLFAYVFGGAIDVEGAGYKEYLIGGILIQTLAFAMMGPATSIATDLKEGVIDRFRSLPSRRAAYLFGHYLAELVGSILTIIVLLGTGLIVGWRTHSGILDVLQGLALLLAFASAMIWLGLWLGILVRSPEAVMGIGFVIVFPVTFLSNAFVPIESLPNVLQWIASVNPISVLVRQPGCSGDQRCLAPQSPGTCILVVHRRAPRARLGSRAAPLQGPHHRLTDHTRMTALRGLGVLFVAAKPWPSALRVLGVGTRIEHDSSDGWDWPHGHDSFPGRRVRGRRSGRSSQRARGSADGSHPDGNRRHSGQFG